MVTICGGCNNLTSACTCLSKIKPKENNPGRDEAREFIRFLLMIAKTVLNK